MSTCCFPPHSTSPYTRHPCNIIYVLFSLCHPTVWSGGTTSFFPSVPLVPFTTPDTSESVQLFHSSSAIYTYRRKSCIHHYSVHIGLALESNFHAQLLADIAGRQDGILSGVTITKWWCELPTLVLCKYRIIKFIQRGELFLVYKVKLKVVKQRNIFSTFLSTYFVNKKEEVLVAGIQMRCEGNKSMKKQSRGLVSRTFYAQCTDVFKVVAINMGIYTEKPTDDGPNGIPEIPGERNA
jgi:hypothetical protein